MISTRAPILLAAAALFAAAPSLAAQINIESLRRRDAPQGLSGSLGASFTVATGNVDFVQLDLNGRLAHVRGPLTTLLIGEGGIGFVGGSRFSSAGLLHFRQTWAPGRIAPEWYAQIDYDRQRLLDFRSLAGAGARTDLARGDWGRLGVGVSLMLEHERLSLPPTALHEARTTTLRNSTFLALRAVLGDHLVLTSTAYVQPALSDPAGDVRVLEDLSLAASITERLALTVTFDLRYDDGPPDGIAGLDTRLRTGLTLTY